MYPSLGVRTVVVVPLVMLGRHCERAELRKHWGAVSVCCILIGGGFAVYHLPDALLDSSCIGLTEPDGGDEPGDDDNDVCM